MTWLRDILVPYSICIMSNGFFDDLQDSVARLFAKFCDFLDDGTSSKASESRDEEIGKASSESKIVVALDIGSSKVVMMVGRLSSKKLIEVLGFSETLSEGVTRGVISNILKTTAAIRKTLADIHKQTNISVLQVYVNVSGPINRFYPRGILIRADLNEEISEKDIEKLRSDISQIRVPPGNEVIYIAAEQYIIDKKPNVKDPVGMSGIRIEADFLVLSASIIAIRNLYRCLSISGLFYDTAVPTPIASAEGVLCEIEKEEGVAVLDIGASVSCIAIYENGVVQHAEIIPLGGNSITNDLKQYFGLVYKHAELLKKEFGAAMTEGISENEYVNITFLRGRRERQILKKEIAEIIQSRLEELIGLAYSSMLTALAGRKLQFGIVLTGGTAMLPHLKKLVESITGLECYIGSPDIHLANAVDLPPELVRRLKLPMYATSVGLLKMQLGR